MSAAKRSLTRRGEAQSAAQPPASKRLKTTNGSHVLAEAGLGFLVDEDKRAGKKLEAKLTNGVPRSKATQVDESRAVIAKDDESDDAAAVDDNDDSEDDSDDDDDSEDESASDMEDDIIQNNPTAVNTADGKALTNGVASDEKPAPEDADDGSLPDADDAEEHEDLSFGDILRNRHPSAIDVSAAFPNSDKAQRALATTSQTGRSVPAAPSGTSLGTVLTQALKTNDKDLLESCLQTTDIDTIKATIERLQSQHVAALLQRLAERVHRRPGRMGRLMMWMQWTLIAHGGYLASQPELMKKVRALAQVVRERAKGLQPLLHLKGKLDMLSGQLELRRKIQMQSRAANALDEEDEDIVYVEGQEDDERDDWSDSENNVDETGDRSRRTARKLRHLTGAEDAGDEDGEAIPNGVLQEESEDASDAEEDEEDDGMLDIEAQEASDDEDEDDGADSDEEADSEEDESESSSDASDDDESDASGVKEPKPQMLKRRR